MSAPFAMTLENADLLDDLETKHEREWSFVAAAMLFGVTPSDRALAGWQGWQSGEVVPCPLAGLAEHLVRVLALPIPVGLPVAADLLRGNLQLAGDVLEAVPVALVGYDDGVT